MSQPAPAPVAASPAVPGGAPSASPGPAARGEPVAQIYRQGDWEFACQSGPIATSAVIDAVESALQMKAPEMPFFANFLRIRHAPSGITFAFDARHALAECKASYKPELDPSLAALPSAAAAADPDTPGSNGDVSPAPAKKPALTVKDLYTSPSAPLPAPPPVLVRAASLWSARRPPQQSLSQSPSQSTESLTPSSSGDGASARSASEGASPAAVDAAMAAALTPIAARDRRFAFDWTFTTPYAGHTHRWRPIVAPAPSAHGHAHGHCEGGSGDCCNGSDCSASASASADAETEAVRNTTHTAALSLADKLQTPTDAPAAATAAEDIAASSSVPVMSPEAIAAALLARAADAPPPAWQPVPAASSATGGALGAPGGIPYDHLRRREAIVFAASLPLYEDELHDFGATRLSLKLRIMPSCFFLMMRCFVRVDGVLVRSRETRLFHFFGSNEVLREARHGEATFEQLAALGHPAEVTEYRDEDVAASRLPVRALLTQRLCLDGGEGEGDSDCGNSNAGARCGDKKGCC